MDMPRIPDAFISLVNEKAQKRIAELEAENERLRDALKEISTSSAESRFDAEIMKRNAMHALGTS